MNRIDTIRQACLKIQAENNLDNLQFLANFIVDSESVMIDNDDTGSELSELDFN